LNIYSKKQRWKFGLAAIAAIIVLVSLWYTSILVGKIAEEEKNKAKSWAEAIQKKAELVNYTQNLFSTITEEERKRVEIWAEANRRVALSDVDEDPTFYTQILFSNTTIPMILTDESGSIITHSNLDPKLSIDSSYLIKRLSGMQQKQNMVKIQYYRDKANFLFFDQSTIFSELERVLGEQVESFNSDIISNSASAPVIYTDSSKSLVLAFGNIDSTRIQDSHYLSDLITEMSETNPPIEVDLGDNQKHYIFYNDSPLLIKLKYYPFIQLGVIGLFLLIAYYLFSTARKSEQNQVWVGMAKETAHQLGTPLSSLLAWIEVLKIRNVDEKTIAEMSRDLGRLETVTERFSKIGATPNLEQHNINKVIENTLIYLKTRLSKKVNFKHTSLNKNEVFASINVPLLEWVLENIIKNGVDALGGEGNIDILVTDQSQFVYIDISDNGKGIPKGARKTVFEPGFTTKKRGWGLGLSLTKRIIENYHSGKVFVKQSELKKGTTFRIVLNKATENGRNIHSYSIL
jgi:hypothetical protein